MTDGAEEGSVGGVYQRRGEGWAARRMTGRCDRFDVNLVGGERCSSQVRIVDN